MLVVSSEIVEYDLCNVFYNKLLLKRGKHEEYRDQYFQALGYFINFSLKK